MDHFSQETTSLHRLSGMSQTDSINRLSVASEGSGQTLFHEIAQSDEGGSGRRLSGLRTKSLEDISSLSLTVHRDADGTTIKAKRNVRTVRISDTVEVSPAGASPTEIDQITSGISTELSIQAGSSEKYRSTDTDEDKDPRASGIVVTVEVQGIGKQQEWFSCRSFCAPERRLADAYQGFRAL